MCRRIRRLKLIPYILVTSILIFRVFLRQFQPSFEEKPPMNDATRNPRSSTSSGSSTSVPSRCQFQNDGDNALTNLVDVFDVDFRVELAYPTFTPRMPHFIDDSDLRLFLDDPINQRYLSPPPSRELTGKVRIVRDGIIRIGGHECSWLTTVDEFTGNTSEEQTRHHIQNTSLKTLCPLLVPDGQTFQHFVDGVLPKLVQLFGVVDRPTASVGEAGQCDDIKASNIEYLLYRPRDYVIYEMLEQLGISRRQMRFVTPPDYEKPRENIITSKRLIDTCVTPAVHPILWRRARRLLVENTSRQENHHHAVRDADDYRKSMRDRRRPRDSNKESSITVSSARLNQNEATPPANSSHVTNWIKRRIQRVRYERDSTDGDDQPGSTRWVILLSRRWSRNRGRRLLNERVIFEDLVGRFGWSNVVLYPDRHGNASYHLSTTMSHTGSLMTARRLFAAARMIVGVHGGAFYNTVMAPANCTVIEVMPLTTTSGQNRQVPRGLAHTIVWRMAEALGHNYWRLYETTSEGHGGITLPVDRLRAVLDIVDSR